MNSFSTHSDCHRIIRSEKIFQDHFFFSKMTNTGIVIPISYLLRNYCLWDRLGMTWLMSLVLTFFLLSPRTSRSCWLVMLDLEWSPASASSKLFQWIIWASVESYVSVTYNVDIFAPYWIFSFLLNVCLFITSFKTPISGYLAYILVFQPLHCFMHEILFFLFFLFHFILLFSYFFSMFFLVTC